eukprot:Lankesteria_metandrocarpae@DN4456_c0_g1_i2.p1
MAKNYCIFSFILVIGVSLASSLSDLKHNEPIECQSDDTSCWRAISSGSFPDSEHDSLQQNLSNDAKINSMLHTGNPGTDTGTQNTTPIKIDTVTSTVLATADTLTMDQITMNARIIAQGMQKKHEAGHNANSSRTRGNHDYNTSTDTTTDEKDITGTSTVRASAATVTSTSVTEHSPILSTPDAFMGDAAATVNPHTRGKSTESVTATASGKTITASATKRPAPSATATKITFKTPSSDINYDDAPATSPPITSTTTATAAATNTRATAAATNTRATAAATQTSPTGAATNTTVTTPMYSALI